VEPGPASAVRQRRRAALVFRRGAEQRKAQSAVSTAIALLESDLGVSLFERSSGRQPR
jgi:hypothetical protein